MVVSFINFKGGVGKTTLCVEIAAALVSSNGFKEKVLIIDLDPQTNATLSLMTENAWRDFATTKGTLRDFLTRIKANAPDKPAKNKLKPRIISPWRIE